MVFVFFLLGYCFGSIPFGLLITWFFAKVDVRESGSGNIGSTNVMRVGGKKLAAATLLADTLKATLAISLARSFSPLEGDENLHLFTAVGVMIGHIFPIWLKFKGGKGVATFLGSLLALSGSASLLFCAIWIYCFSFTRLSSFAGLTAPLAVTFFLYANNQAELFLLSMILTTLIWIRHYQNIRRLLAGKEKPISERQG